MSVRYKDQATGKINGISLSKDLCRDGLKVASNEPIARGTILDLEIDIPDDPKSVYSVGEVVWTKVLEGDPKSYEHGVKFHTIDPVDKFRVLDYAYNSWLEAKVIDFSDPEQIPDVK